MIYLRKKNNAISIFIVAIVTIVAITNCYAFSLWGYTPQSGITYAPIGFHWQNYLEGRPQPNDMNHIVALNYKSLVVGTFIDSYQNDLARIYLLAFERNIINRKKFKMSYTVGLVYGYRGKLAQVSDFQNPILQDLMKGDINPCAYLTFKYHLNKHFALISMLTVNYLTVGIKLVF